MDKRSARRAIVSIFAKLKSVDRHDIRHLRSLEKGKIYELYSLVEVLKYLRERGFRLSFHGTSLKFNTKGKDPNAADPHFHAENPLYPQLSFDVYVDVYFRTLGSQVSGHNNDRSLYHELDIAVLMTRRHTRPQVTEVALAVECKAVAKFTKDILRNMLGLRRELSYYHKKGLPSTISSSLPLGGHHTVPANPPSELWLLCTDPKVKRYVASPAVFGIELRHLEP